MDLKKLQKSVFDQARERGLYDMRPTASNLFWHIREEAAEVVRAWRKYKDLRTHYECSGTRRVCEIQNFNCNTCPCRKNEGVTQEIADVIIMALSACEYLGIDVEQAIKEKMEYNAIRQR